MSSVLVVALVSVIAMLIAWQWQEKNANAGIVDVVWAFGMMGAGPWYALTGPAPWSLKATLAVLTGAWFMRLGSHLAQRTFKHPEDSRYQAMRQAMGEHAPMGFLVFFILQAGFISLLSLPFFAVAQTLAPNLIAVTLAVLIAAVALWGEMTADHQLAHFKKNPLNQGKTCREAWWRYSRHPNYFFEWLHWFAYPLLGWGGPYQGWLWFAPLFMGIFLVFLTGIPFSEQQALRTRGEDYRRYQQVTSMFFPWPPKTD
jgi:cyclopropane-fatty-acyl-phospholipid synthase